MKPLPDNLRATMFVAFVITLLISCAATLGAAQSGAAPRKLPSAEKVVESYLKTIGGKKRLATIRDATYEWRIQLKDQIMGLAKTQTKTPSSVRTEMSFGNGQGV